MFLFRKFFECQEISGKMYGNCLSDLIDLSCQSKRDHTMEKLCQIVNPLTCESFIVFEAWNGSLLLFQLFPNTLKHSFLIVNIHFNSMNSSMCLFTFLFEIFLLFFVWLFHLYFELRVDYTMLVLCWVMLLLPSKSCCCRLQSEI